ncbi:zinc-dependent peptidase [Bizionia gelidisalsuginis]|uniref:Zinc-dependent peptidase n=1 Tax=Bizionia gelidisalsuginis TaxID=291188 RepID=A0ABY3MEL9_9FLAO|nr:M90 family metallopeptidase [Bizionia gelidisalsuginis]TYC18049.1 zinc-dependent peptidase [Bizionia gelidisalsuginis]
MIYIILFIILVGFGIFAFSKLKRKDVAPFPKHWGPVLEAEVAYYNTLSSSEKQRFRKRMMAFLSEVTIEGVKLELEDLDRILIAASAVIPVFGFKEWYYNNLSGIILYPDTFNSDLQFADQNKDRRILGMVGNGRFENQMLLSRRALRQAFKNDTDKLNTPVHEFVHLIDKMDGITDGIPEQLLGRDYIKPWLELMHHEMQAINNDTSDIRKYASFNEAEFFAVVSEYFFERPQLFKKKHPELFKMLVLCFQQQPAKKRKN